MFIFIFIFICIFIITKICNKDAFGVRPPAPRSSRAREHYVFDLLVEVEGCPPLKGGRNTTPLIGKSITQMLSPLKAFEMMDRFALNPSSMLADAPSATPRAGGSPGEGRARGRQTNNPRPAKPPKDLACPRHHQAGRRAGPHQYLSKPFHCGCCVGTCEQCDPTKDPWSPSYEGARVVPPKAQGA